MSLRNKKLITNSEIQAFKDCRLAWYFEWIEGLRPIEPAPQLFFGIGIHVALAEFYRNLTKPDANIIMRVKFVEWFHETLEKIKMKLKIDAFSDEQKEKYDELYLLGLGMLEGYCRKYWDKDIRDFEIIDIEKEFTIPILTSSGHKSHVDYRGRVDLVVKDDIGYWILDHKTAISTETDIYEVDEQATSYIMATQYALQIQIKGIIYNILKKKLPREPRILQSGQLSKDKSIDTTYKKYLETIHKHNLNVNDFVDILELLKEKGDTFFVRERFQRNQTEIKNQNDRIYNVTHDMYKEKGAHIYFRPSFDCNWRCGFKDLCLARQDGSDIEYLKKAMFVKEDRWI